MSNERLKDEWTKEINSFSYRFKLSEVWEYRDLLFLFIRRDFVSFYKQTILGPVWFFIQPVFTTVTYTIIFTKIAGMSTGATPPVLFYLLGTILWNFFQDSVIKTSTVFRDNAGIFGKVYFPRIITPISLIISNLFKLGIQFVLFILLYLYYILNQHNSFFSVYILFFPLAIFLSCIYSLAFGLIISSLTNKYRDLSFLITYGIQLAMYATPIIYPLSSIPTQYRSLFSLNPFAHIIELTRLGFFGDGIFNFIYLIYTVLLALVLLFLGVYIFNRIEKNFIDTV